ncbi:hypothetical protein F3B53_17195 [Bacteroides ovatus]|uniref:Uncharacterized protein n=1 Tax=Bacteroides ovatus TaxID=28116 RepID=A0A6A1XEF4_BACOV|nr:hypothetical protein F3B53_17195 [Bacteroides ovatus]
MIKFSQIPYSTYSYDGMPKPTWVKATCPPNGIPHNFSLSDDDMLTYYLEIFRNRTAKDKPYIDQYNSIEELEEDIYGNCLFMHQGWKSMDFKKVYSMLDKGLFIEKMNNMIKDYGNLIIDLNNPNDLSYNIYSTTRIDWDNKSDSF